MLTGKVVLVSGGSGSIGAAICRVAAREGAEVAFSYRRKAEAAGALAAEIEALGRRCHAGPVDAGDAASITGFVADVERRFSRIDVLVNNLGGTQVMPFPLIEEEDWDAMMTVNLKSTFLFSKAVVKGMIRRRAGAIVNIGSIAGQRMLEVPVHYAVAKAGLTGFTVSLARELSRYGVRVNAVAPGLIEGGLARNVSARQREEYNRYCALGRSGSPEEIAEVVAFLASDRASYINGQSLVADGGL